MMIDYHKIQEAYVELFNSGDYCLNDLEAVSIANYTKEKEQDKIVITLKDRSYITFILYKRTVAGKEKAGGYDVISYNHRLNIRTTHSFRLTKCNYKIVYEWTLNLIEQAKKPIF